MTLPSDVASGPIFAVCVDLGLPGQPHVLEVASSTVPLYISKADPFVSLDIEGVGTLVRWATERGREAKPDLKIGVCGEHGGDAESIEFFNKLGFNYVSCSPFRVPVARLAAARAELKKHSKT